METGGFNPSHSHPEIFTNLPNPSKIVELSYFYFMCQILTREKSNSFFLFYKHRLTEILFKIFILAVRIGFEGPNGTDWSELAHPLSAHVERYKEWSSFYDINCWKLL